VNVLFDLLAAATERHSARQAVSDRRGSWTYQELADYSLRTAAWLVSEGLRVADRLLVQAESRREVAALLFGCARAGVTFVPVSPAAKPFQLRQITLDAEPRAAIRLGGPSVDGATTWHDLDRVWSQVTGMAPLSGPMRAGPDDVAMLLYTSGSTGAPKGVICPHRAILYAARAVQDHLRYGPDDVVFCRIPLSFDYGLYQVLLAALAGAELFLADAGHDGQLVNELSGRGATVVPLVPTLAEMLLRLATRSPRANRVRLFTNTGERLPPPTLAGLRARFPTARWQLMFGTTECKRISIMEPDGDRLRPESVGRPLRGTQVVIAARDGKPLPPGRLGEILVRGPHVMAGYWRAGNATARTFLTGPDGQVTLRTGDFGYEDEDGYLYFMCRQDGIFKSKGMRTSCAEIEAAAQDVPGVRQAVVVPPRDGAGALLYYSGDLTPPTLRRELLRRLETPKVPAVCIRLDVVPMSDNGKVDRSLLAARAGATSEGGRCDDERG
jgi:acyl-CoA synthetase (AMP-forming)/AMP-acid ligase II